MNKQPSLLDAIWLKLFMVIQLNTELIKYDMKTRKRTQFRKGKWWAKVLHCMGLDRPGKKILENLAGIKDGTKQLKV